MREFNENILESLDTGLVVFDADEKIVRWNRALEEFYGVAREAAIGKRNQLETRLVNLAPQTASAAPRP